MTTPEKIIVPVVLNSMADITVHLAERKELFALPICGGKFMLGVRAWVAKDHEVTCRACKRLSRKESQQTDA